MTYLKILLLLLSFNFTSQVFSKEPDFSKEARIEKGSNRANIYVLEKEKLAKMASAGRKHALSYPVDITGLQLPDTFIDRILERKVSGIKGPVVNKLIDLFAPWDSVDGLYKWLGLVKHSDSGKDLVSSNHSPYLLPSLADLDSHYLGATKLKIDGLDSKALTFSCAACHVGELFGTPIVGLTNRNPRAFDFIEMGVKAKPLLRPSVAAAAVGLNQSERQMIEKTFESVHHIKTKSKLHPSLDTSLAIVGLSLSKRKEDEYATRDRRVARRPRPNPLNYHSVDSKPAVWWNVKYKTRWLSDGSVVSGNPIFTNILWNEIGRGSDLKELEAWLEDNSSKVEQLTSLVFSTEAPRYTDFFDFSKDDIKLAEKGRLIYEERCAKCHGVYLKKWQQIPKLNWKEHNTSDLVKTLKVIYHEKTPVIDVGTDPNRYQGMKYFADDLNRLKISKSFNTAVEPQKGYVPPPLVGIWARWPYFHNNSVSSLCEVLTPASKRLKSYLAVDPIDKEKDFDSECNGYPRPEELKNRRNAIKYTSNKKGLLNIGHDERILIKDGKMLISPFERRALIKFLQTL